MNWTAAAAIMLALAVSIGAFGAHGLQGRLDTYSLGVYEKGVFYHFIHGLGMLAVPLLVRAGLISKSAGAWAGWLLLAGIVLFSGSLYALAITGMRTLGAITPFGGASFIAAWVVIAVCALLSRRG
ncbi:MAG: DUF423 domain-containing protein [Acidobacteriia bacterium]|nr:DUF423 domain-containing protein [Terriglobia bacterium]